MLNPVYNISQTLASFGIEATELENIGQTNALVNDTRVLNENDVFCAVIGSTLDGRQYIDNAIELGAKLVIAECQSQQLHGQVLAKTVAGKSTLVVQFYQLNEQLFELCQHYYQMPQQSLKIVGITGTNGKTSTSQILAQLIDLCQQTSACAVIGTNGAGVLPTLSPILNTTPGATELMGLLAKFAHQSLSHVAMEVSSHALEQKRVKNDLFDVAVFTNLSRDHLDYHQTMAAYGAAKLAIFSGDEKQTAVVNGDDEFIKEWLSEALTQPVIVYGCGIEITQHRDYFYATNIRCHDAGTRFELHTPTERHQINSPLIGRFNIENLLAAMASAQALGFDLPTIIGAVEKIQPIDGRMELFAQVGKPSAVVDYAHTPDALEKALVACRAHCQGKLHVVFGCGGDRDKGKRPEMGRVAEQNADCLIITNDNPRTEAPEMIVADILQGLQQPEKARVVLDRKQAVNTVISHASEGDMVLLAGKGHEDYIIIGEQKIDYNERQLVSSYYTNSNTIIGANL
ncbi:UDP-N-acetylmuramoyl-L-alanyl-D-glutamate--2,6-diaminopimelate ligase [Thalassotalea sp. LPB0316]|uniref:UDP-N-acetylmuramoyl-L-alanyl-D-glutamate--2, 6-diaminopimelate ligase n=1 Tax=Thalassotalea sp. LPB0316 TaxID=2769490 RepID=UPI0018684097|nr:UDP-N-acetylmuramoyl-L-alanyl-D-glutamate--2,6-diaminopimelate ligase [Thalassotalea sp. LPB0316]QOL25907.1 UDP-N-acetylmuramoyl-L-alanyl-D-glutamate--2,6-diaminopimelate ligase [Thalassotalea sp. LPB0316]